MTLGKTNGISILKLKYGVTIKLHDGIKINDSYRETLASTFISNFLNHLLPVMLRWRQLFKKGIPQAMEYSQSR
jgi:accessory gene regulator protein AgrB